MYWPLHLTLASIAIVVILAIVINDIRTEKRHKRIIDRLTKGN